MKKLELVFYCCNPRSSPCPKTFCIINGHACLFLKAEWETSLKESTPANNATPHHSPAAAEPQKAPMAEAHIKPAKQKPSEKPCSPNIESHQNMGVWKK